MGPGAHLPRAEPTRIPPWEFRLILLDAWMEEANLEAAMLPRMQEKLIFREREKDETQGVGGG